MPHAFVLDQSPLDSPVFALDGDGSLALPDRDILVEIEDARHITTGALTTLYFGSCAYNHPSAPAYYAPRLEQPLLFRRDIYSAQTTGGAGRQSYGELKLINNDSNLDFVRDYAIAGCRLRMLIGNAGNGLSDPGEPYDDFELLIVARVQQRLSNTSDLTIQLRDRLQDLAEPVPASKFLGDNVLPSGLEGVDTDDLKDKPKPLLRGLAVNFAPPCVNTSRLIWQINDGSYGFAFVYDNGVVLTPGADYTDRNDMETNAPIAGTYRMWKAGGYFRLGAVPTGTVTATSWDYTDTDDGSPARVALRVATITPTDGQGGIDATDIEYDDIEALDTANFSEVGAWWNNGETYASVLDAILTSVGAWYGFDRLGRFRVQRLELPVSPYEVTFRIASLSNPLALGEFDIINYRFVPSSDPERGLPSYRVSLEYARNFTVQSASTIAGSVSQARRNFLSKAFQTEVTPDDPTIKQTYPMAVEKKVRTLLIQQADAATEAARLLEIFKEERHFLEIDVILARDLITYIDLGSVVNVVLPRFDYDAGKLMRVIGMQYNVAAGLLTLVLWG
jgi:hypothetical protein